MTFADRPRPPRGPVVVASVALGAVLGAAALGAAGAIRFVDPAAPAEAPPQAPLSVPTAPAQPVAEPAPLRVAAATVRIGRQGTFVGALEAMGLRGPEAASVVSSLGREVDFGRLKPDAQVRLERLEGASSMRRLSLRLGPADEWIVEPGPGGAPVARRRQFEITTRLARVEVEIETSPWEAMQGAGEDPALAVLASDALAFDVDFYQEVRRGDRLAVLVEKVMADGRFLRFGAVRAVEYAGEVAARRLYLWAEPGGSEAYYDDEGNGARRAFLRAPLRYSHLTSRYGGGRKHPVLGYTRAHRGVDYAAPDGTPVWAAADGSVAASGIRGACGKSVVLRHRNGFSTEYCHLSSIAVKAGERVAQKQVIGASGHSGLATGPHLHYAVRRDGAPVNPLELRAPRDAPVPDRYRSEFARAIAPLQAELRQGSVASK